MNDNRFNTENLAKLALAQFLRDNPSASGYVSRAIGSESQFCVHVSKAGTSWCLAVPFFNATQL